MTTATADTSSAPNNRRIRAVLAIPAFRRLWGVTYLCSIGDWLSLLALAGLAAKLLSNSYLGQSFAFSGVVLTQLAPGLIFAPLGGVLADKFDRRKVMVACDLLRCASFLSIPFVDQAWWLFVASFINGSLAMMWIPAKDSAIPNLLRHKHQIETANQLGLVMTYGFSVITGFGLYTLITGANTTLHLGASTLGIAKIVVIINGLLYLSSAILVGTRIPELSKRDPTQTQAVDRAAPREGKSGFFQMFSDGFRFAMSTPLVRGLIIGMVGAFAAGGAAIGTARQYALSLLGGESTIGLLFLSLFVGLAIGMVGAPKLAARMSHNRIFGLAIVAAGMLLALAALSPQLAISLLLVALVGGCAGVAFLTGVTIIGSQVADAMRGRVNAVYQSLMKIILFASTVVVPLLVSLVHPHTITLFHRQMTIDGTRPVLLGAGLLAAVFGLFAYRQMGDRSTEPILSNLLRVVRGTDKRTSGVLLAVEGEVASDNSARAAQIGQWLAEAGYRVVLAGDPTVEELRMRAALGEAQLSSTRAIALMAAAFRADLVERRIRPALNSGAVVIMERYLDTPLAHLGALGGVPAEEVESVVDWATGHLRADLTVLIEHSPPAEVPPESTVSRRFGAEHRWRVQSLLADMASADPERYLVIDAHSEPTPTAELIRDRVAAVLRRRHRRAERDDQHAAALSANGVPGMHEDTGH